MNESAGPTLHDNVSTNDGTMLIGTGTQFFSWWTAWQTNDGSAFGLRGPGALAYEVTNNPAGDYSMFFTNNTHIEVPYNTNLDGPTWSVEMWLTIPAVLQTVVNNDTDMFPLSFIYNGSQQGGFNISVKTGSSGSKLGQTYAWAGKGAGWSTINTANVVYTNRVLYVVQTYTNGAQSLYTNGVLCGVTLPLTAYRQVGSYTNWPMLIGCYDNTPAAYRGKNFQGGISHLAVYNYALTPSQVSDHWTMGTYGPTPAAIVANPVGFTNYAGYAKSLSVTASGSRPVSYQWMKDGTPIANATNSVLTFSPLGTNDTGNYTVRVSNSGATVTNTPVSVAVLSPTNIYQAEVIGGLPLAYYPMNETNGSNCIDIINVNNAQATYSGAPVFGGSGASDILGTAPQFLDWASGVFVNDPNSLGVSGNITMEAWVQPFDANGSDQIFMANGPYLTANPHDSYTEMGIRYLNGVANYFIETAVIQYNGANYTFTTNGAYFPVPDGDWGQWLHIAAVADGVNWKLYRNGTNVASVADTQGNFSAWGWGFGCQSLAWANPQNIVAAYNGGINNVAIYGKALSGWELYKHYYIGLNGVAPTTPSLGINISATVTNAVLTWNLGTLQQASSLTGPWSDVPGASSPYTLTPATNGNQQLFFRSALTP